MVRSALLNARSISNKSFILNDFLLSIIKFEKVIIVGDFIDDVSCNTAADLLSLTLTTSPNMLKGSHMSRGTF